MAQKILDLYPKLTYLSEDKLDLSNFTAVAIPVLQGEQIEIPKTKFLTAVSNFTKLDLNIELNNWSEFAAKPGEIIEVPISVGSLTRIYLVGIGDKSNDDLRKASTSLGRKLKGTNCVLLSALETEKAKIITQGVAFILSNYQYSLKSDQKVQKPTFVIYGDYKDEVEYAEILASSVWQARNLIHTPSNIKNPEWLAKQATAMVSAAKNSDLSITVKSGRALKEFGGLLAGGRSTGPARPACSRLARRVPWFPHRSYRHHHRGYQ